jgi:hypothetical protein
MIRDIYSRDKIEQISEAPGCYIWYFNISRIREEDFTEEQSRKNLLEALFSIHQPNSMYVSVSRLLKKDKVQQFGENYNGHVCIDEESLLSFSEIVTNEDTFKLFLQITGSLPIPIYIGKSENLNRRLKQHDLFLQNIPSSDNLTQEEYDSLKNFSERVNNIMEKHRISGIHPNMLHVKVVYLPLDAISNFETNLNRLYKPILGIK